MIGDRGILESTGLILSPGAALRCGIREASLAPSGLVSPSHYLVSGLEAGARFFLSSRSAARSGKGGQAG